MHSINAAASAADTRPLHEHYRATRRVFSMELPGHGFAERSDRPYTPRLVSDAIHAMTDEIRRRCGELFRGLTRPGMIRYFLRRTWGADHIDEGLWKYSVVTTRQPGAEYAPLCFLGGGLFSADIHSICDRLELPVWVSHGVRGNFTNYRHKSVFARRPNWSFAVLQTGALPYFEEGERFTAGYDAFLRRTQAPAAGGGAGAQAR